MAIVVCLSGWLSVDRQCFPTPVSQTEASASVWRGGAIERKQAFAALTATADAQPVRFATTRKPVRSFPTRPQAAPSPAGGKSRAPDEGIISSIPGPGITHGYLLGRYFGTGEGGNTLERYAGANVRTLEYSDSVAPVLRKTPATPGEDPREGPAGPSLAVRRGPGEPFGRFPGRSFGSFPIAGKGTPRRRGEL